jgi:exopolysaccharide biosynthesis protein
MAVGQRDDESLVFLAVDGRDYERAPGLTLAQTAAILGAQGCHTAMNLDGGSSKRMFVGGEVVDLPSTEVTTGAPSARVRRLRTAILIRPR